MQYLHINNLVFYYIGKRYYYYSERRIFGSLDLWIFGSLTIEREKREEREERRERRERERARARARRIIELYFFCFLFFVFCVASIHYVLLIMDAKADEPRMESIEIGYPSPSNDVDNKGVMNRGLGGKRTGAALAKCQFRAIMRKNFRVFSKQKSLIAQDMMTMIIYYAILIGLSLTTQSTISPSTELRPIMAISNVEFPIQVYQCHYPSSVCQIAFVDTASRSCNGSSPVEKYASEVPMCAHSAISCVCLDDDAAFKNYTSAIAYRAGVVFKNAQANDFADFTVYSSDGYSVFNPEKVKRYQNPKAGGNENSDFLRDKYLPVASQVLLTNRKRATGVDTELLVQMMGKVETETNSAGALMNLPFYMSMLFMYGVLNVVYSIAGERNLKVEKGMFMCGLKPFIYWYGWAVVAAIRQSITILIGFIVTCVLILKEASPLLVLLTYVIFAIYTILFGLFLGTIMTKAKTAQNVLLWGATFMAAPVYANAGVILDVNASAVLPPAVVYLVGAILAPFSFAQTLCAMLLLDSKLDGGATFSNLFVTTRADVSVGANLCCMIGATLLQFAVTEYFMRRKSGPAKTGQGGGDKGEQYGSYQAPGAESSSVAVSIRNLKKSFGDVHAVNGLTVDFCENQVTAFLGHNGAGKTTTMQMLTGLHRPNDGDAFIYGTSITHDMPKIRSRIGVCPQENVLWDILTVEEHVLLFGGLRGFEENEIDVNEILNEVGLAEKRNTNVKSLSGGQKRKLQVALSLVGDPAVVFLDEPTAGMDSEARREVWALIGRKKEGRAIVLTTHQMDEAEILGDKIAIIDKGHLQEQGTPEELKVKYSSGFYINISFGTSANRRGLFEMVKACDSSARIDVKEIVGDDASDAEVKRAELAELDARGKGDITVVIPAGNSGKLASIFAMLEKVQKTGEYDVEFGVTSTSLEDVFVQLANESAAAPMERAGSMKSFSGSSRDFRELKNVDVDIENRGDQSVELRPISTAARLHLLVKLNAGRALRNWVKVLTNTIMPLGMVVVAVIVMSIDFFPTQPDPAIVALNPSAALASPPGSRFTLPLTGSGATFESFKSALEGMEAADASLPRSVDVTDSWNDSGEYKCFNGWLMDSKMCNGSDPIEYNGTSTRVLSEAADAAPLPRVGAVRISGDSIKIVYNYSNTYALPGLVAYAYSALGGSRENSPNFESYPKMPKTPEEQKIRDQVKMQIQSGIAPIMLIFSLPVAAALFAFDVAEERIKGTTHLQTLMGVKMHEMWFARFIFDYSQTFLVSSITVALFAAADTYLGNIETLIFLCVFFGACLPVAYMIQYTADTPQKAIGAVSTFFLITGILGYLPFYILNFPGIDRMGHFIVMPFNLVTRCLQIITHIHGYRDRRNIIKPAMTDKNIQPAVV